MKTQFFRAFVCLLLVCCLVVNVSPLRAEAVAIEAVVIGVSATIVVGSILIGLGVLPGESFEAFTMAVNSCIDSLTVSGIVNDGLISVLRLADYGYRHGVVSQIIEAVRNWAYESDTILTGSVVSDGFAFYNGMLLPSITTYSGYLYYYIVSHPDGSISEYCCMKNDYPFYVWDNSGTSVFGSGYYCYVWPLLSDAWGDRSKELIKANYFSLDEGYDILWSSHDVLDNRNGVGAEIYIYGSEPIYESEITVAEGLIAGEISSEEDNIAVGYPAWFEGSITVPGSITGDDENDEVRIYPVGLGQDFESMQDYTQADVWEGVSTYEDDVDDTTTDAGTSDSTGILSDIWSAIKAIPSAFADWFTSLIEGVQAIPGRISDVIDSIRALPATISEAIATYFIPSQPWSYYKLDLSGAFPFCIPYDIFEFLKVLCADPVAPVFDWVIPVPQLGREFEITVDLSEWDSVAELFRRLEWLAFTVGLLYVSKDKFLGG